MQLHQIVKMGTLALVMAAMVGCGDVDKGTSATQGEDFTATDLVGVWAMNSMDINLYLTTSSNQTAWDIFKPGTGAITVSGAYSASLGYVRQKDGAVSVVDFPAHKSDEYPNFNLIAASRGIGGGITVDILILTYAVSKDSNIVFTANNSFTLDTVSHTLTVDDVVLISATGDDSVRVDGVVTQRSVAVPADIKTSVTTFVQDDLDRELHLASDSTSLLVENVSTSPDSSSGTWEVLGDTLALYHLVLVNGAVVYDTTYIDVFLNGNNVLGTMLKRAWCDVEQPQDTCFMNAEAMLSLDAGSVTDIMNGGTVNMIRTSTLPKTVTVLKGSSTLFCGSCIRTK